MQLLKRHFKHIAVRIAKIRRPGAGVAMEIAKFFILKYSVSNELESHGKHDWKISNCFFLDVSVRLSIYGPQISLAEMKELFTVYKHPALWITFWQRATEFNIVSPGEMAMKSVLMGPTGVIRSWVPYDVGEETRWEVKIEKGRMSGASHLPRTIISSCDHP